MLPARRRQESASAYANRLRQQGFDPAEVVQAVESSWDSGTSYDSGSSSSSSDGGGGCD